MSNNQKRAFLDDLNPMQRAAAIQTAGPLLIIAGAGSGKTRTLVYRLALILSQNLQKLDEHRQGKGNPPSRILAITFTNKAAEEMRSRVAKILKKSSIRADIEPFIGTFHSFGAKILRSISHFSGRSSNFTIYDEEDSLSLIKEILKKKGWSWRKVSSVMIKSEIGRIKNELLDIQGASPMEDGEVWDQILSVYPEYERMLRENGAFDFDDLIEKPVRIFQTNPAVLQSFRDMYGHILIDEYQDTNIAQYTLVRMLAEIHRNLCVVGDDAQSIYRWRSADFRNFLNFDKDWTGARVIKLEQNYRSTKNILKAADAVIGKNLAQKKKILWTENEKGAPVWVVEQDDERSEARFVAKTIQEKIFSGTIGPEEIAVFYRTNAQSRAIEEAFLENRIPYRIIGGIRFYERKEVKDIIAYLRVAVNPLDRVSAERIIAIPPRGISKTRFRKLGANLSLAPELAATLADIASSHTRVPLTELIGLLLEQIQYKEYLRHEYKNSDERWENILELVSLAKQFEVTRPPERALSDFLESIHLMQAQDFSSHVSGNRIELGNSPKGVSLMTIHSAKGLEFGTVFLVGCEEGILPHARSLYDTEELEEERRLAYVAITRAKKELYMIFTRERTLFGSRRRSAPSQFIYDIPPEITEFVGTASSSLDRLSDEGEEFIEW